MPVHPLAVNTFDESDIEAACDVLRSGNLTMGRLCKKFEKNFADYVGAEHAVFVNSGSSANLIALFLLKQYFSGGEVIVPALTWSTTIWPIIQAGFTPVFVDSDPSTLQMNTGQVLECINANTRAIMVPHTMGSAVDLQAFTRECNERGIWIIEDCCESLGAEYATKKVGTFGHVGTYSFYFSHHMTTIEGGMVVTSNEYVADRLRALRAHGWTRDMDKPPKYDDGIDPRYLFASLGFNVRSTEINAALGLGQLQKLDYMNKERNDNAAFLKELLPSHLSTMTIPRKVKAAWFGFPIYAQSQVDRRRLESYLRANEIEYRPIICGNVTRHPAMQGQTCLTPFALSGANSVMDNGLYIGLHPGMAVARVGEVIRKFV